MRKGMKWVKKANMWCVWVQTDDQGKMKQEIEFFSTEEEAKKYYDEQHEPETLVEQSR